MNNRSLLFINRELDKLYPQPKPFLKHDSVYQLLVSVILSAQCTDERVNKVTPMLFSDCPGPQKVLDLGIKGLIPYIFSCGYYNAKARNIIGMTRQLLDQYEGEVPEDFDELVKLSGVGEKTAGVVLAQAFKVPAFPVDTHIFRLAHRLGLSDKRDPNKVSTDLKALFPKNRWIDLHLQMILHGRTLCTARKPKCGECPLLKVCPEGKRRFASKIEGERVRRMEKAEE
ncbi:MAG: endonuclease III [bacterium]|nr:endonuclease III [bacterium]